MSEFYVGQRVVCVRNDGTLGWENDCPVEGNIYTIRNMVPHRDSVWLHLVELERGPGAKREHGQDVGYYSWRFRPLESKSIQIFRDIAAGITPLIPDDKLDEVEQREIAAIFETGGRPIW